MASPTVRENQFRAAVQASFGEYLAAHGFGEHASESTGRLTTLAFRSSEFWLWLYNEVGGDIYAKVSPCEEPGAGVYLGATLAFLAGTAEPYVGAEALAQELAARHNELAALFAPSGILGREKLDAWVTAYAQRSLEVHQAKAQAARTNRRWWRFGT